LVALLLLSGAIAGGALFAKHKLEGFRGTLLETAEFRTGTEIRFQSIAAFGLRGLRAEGLELTKTLDAGSEVHLKLPLAYVYVDLTELLYGQIQVDRIQVEGAEVIFRRPATAEGSVASPPSFGTTTAALPPISFRVMGTDCRVRIENVAGASTLDVTNISFDVAKLIDSPALSGTIEGLYAGDESKKLKVTTRYVSLDDFEASATIQRVTADDVNVFLPASKQFVLAGSAQPNLRVEGKADGTFALSVETAFEGLLARDQPEFLSALTGALDARATYNPSDRVLRVGMARATTDSLSGAVTGLIDFSNASPSFDLKLTSAQLPLTDIVSFALGDRLEQYGELQYTLSPDTTVALHLTGTADTPSFEVQSSMSGADIAFKSKDKRFPDGDIRLGRVDAVWNSAEKKASGSVAIVDGKIRKTDMDIEATRITGNATISGKRIDISTLTAVVNGETLVSSGWYDAEIKEGEAKAAGIVSGIGEFKLAQSIRNTTLSGSTGVRASGKLSKGIMTFEGDVDASQTEIGYRWYFLKPAGIGATANIKGTFSPKKSVTFDVDGVVAGTQLTAVMRLTYAGKKWQLRSAEAKSDHLDVVSVGKCLPLPYVITGGTARAATYEWKRVDDTPGVEWTAKVALSIDEIAARAEGAQNAIVCKDLTLSGDFIEGESPVTKLHLHAKDAVTPPIRGDKWFAPITRDFKKYPMTNRNYLYTLEADTLEVPPWKGTQFKGSAFQNENENGIEKYTAKIDDGTIEGTYVSNRADNSYKTTAKWSNVPASYFMAHLRQPQIFIGNMNGSVSYTQDRDDPRSLTGTGNFDTSNGQFSADYLISLFERQLEGDVSALPPSLKFSRLESTVEFEGDVVKTPKIHLESDAMALDASGEFVLDGDMNYNIKVAVSPDAAERIPLMRDNFNVQGHRLAQQDIDLAFNLTGPTFRPVSTVSETPPVRVTLVSGALETAREALQVIDAPRKILFDLLKIGGGIVGAKKPPQTGNQN